MKLVTQVYLLFLWFVRKILRQEALFYVLWPLPLQPLMEEISEVFPLSEVLKSRNLSCLPMSIHIVLHALLLACRCDVVL